MREQQRNGVITEYNKPFIEQRADPYILRAQDGQYYFTASVPAYDRIILRRAETLYALADAEEQTIWTRHPAGDMSGFIWAPELHRIDGRWYIYYTASREDDIWRLRPWVLACTGEDPVHDPWEELGQMTCADDDIYSFRAFSLDATTFTAAGVRYFVWAEKVSVGIQISNLYIARMESPTKLSTPQVLLTTPDYDWERVDIWVNEGPAVLQHDGMLYLTYSASATGPGYCVGMLSISEQGDILDPRAWNKSRQPVLRTDETRGFYGPGHNSFTKLPDGRDVCVFHARTYREIEGDPLYDPNRHTMLMEVQWDESNRPVFSYENMLHE